MKVRLLLFGCLIFFSGKSAAQYEDWELIWEDNFDFLDTSKWDHEVTAWGGGVSDVLNN